MRRARSTTEEGAARASDQIGIHKDDELEYFPISSCQQPSQRYRGCLELTIPSEPEDIELLLDL